MTAISQGTLRTELNRRLERVRRAGGPATGSDRWLTAYVVVREIDVATYVRGVVRFTSGLSTGLSRAWLGALTRTVFLAGSCDRIARRHPPSHMAADGSVGWYGPGDPAEFDPLRRLLRAFDGPRLPVDLPATTVVTCESREPARRLRLYVDTRLLGIGDYLVHVNHTLCEAAIGGLLTPDDQVEVRHVSAIDRSSEPWACARVGEDPVRRDRLRLFACLTQAGTGR